MPLTENEENLIRAFEEDPHAGEVLADWYETQGRGAEAKLWRKASRANQDARRELDLYAENTFGLQNQFLSIVNNLKKKIANNKYNPLLVAKLWGYWYESAAKQYGKKHCAHPTDWSKVFPKPVRDAAALLRERFEFRNISNGEHGPLPVKKVYKRRKVY